MIAEFDVQNFWWALKNSLIQGCGTVFLCLVLGTYLAFGYLYFSEKIQTFLKLICQLSLMLPSIFTILICFQIFNPFPYGHRGVIFIFTVMHLGFSVIYISNCIVYRIKKLGFVSQVYNIPRIKFYIRIMLPLIYKDLIVLGLIIFLSCLSSLSIPLVAGGGLGTNLEMYIFEKIFVDQKWSEAITVSLVQGLIIFLIAKFILNHQQSNSQKSTEFVPGFVSSKTAGLILIIYLGIYVFSYLFRVADALLYANYFEIFKDDFKLAFQNSIYIFLSLSLLFLVFILCVLFAIFKNNKINILDLFLSPSTILTGFGLYLLLPSNQFNFDMIKVLCGISALYFVGVYKIYLAPLIENFKNQIIQCHLYQIDFLTFLIRIAWPQLRQHIIFSISILYLISVSEFALMKATGSQILTLGLLTESYLNSYRLQQSYVLSFFSLMSWGLIYYIMRFVYVRDQKFRF